MNDSPSQHIPVLHNNIQYTVSATYACRGCGVVLTSGAPAFKMTAVEYVCRKCKVVLKKPFESPREVYI